MQSNTDVFKWLPKRQRKALNLLYWWVRYRSQQSDKTGFRKAAVIARDALTSFCSRPKYVLFYPDVPRKHGYALKKIMTLLGCSPTNYLSVPTTIAAIKWRDATFTPTCQNLLALARQRRVINGELQDISKRRVEEVFQSVFGYSTFLDPTVHCGVAVQKSDINSRHDGQVIQCPIERPLAGSIYQRLIANDIDEDVAEDIRVPVVGQSIPFVYIKRRQKPMRFKGVDATSMLVGLHEVLSEEEIDRVLRFCRAFRLDYGELDVLRDRADGRIYVVDANTTPYGPPVNMALAQKTQSVILLADTFRKEFL